jgi:hypothetical protein
MKKRTLPTALFMLLSCIVIFLGCSKDEDTDQDATLAITTDSVSRIASTTAFSGGKFVIVGEPEIEKKGLCWSLDTLPDLTDHTSILNTEISDFKGIMTGLLSDTVYHVRAYAVRVNQEIIYGADKSFRTLETDSAICAPPKNSINYSSLSIPFTVGVSTSGLIYGHYGLVANGLNCDLRIEFPAAPITGRYITSRTLSSTVDDGTCNINGPFGAINAQQFCVANPGGVVYVIKTGEGKYSMTFCNLWFTSTTSATTFAAEGNLTTE